MIRLRSLAFNIAFFGWTAVMCFIMAWTLVLPYRIMLGVVHLWLRQVAWIERNIGGITYKVEGFENVPQGTCIIAAKHQSAWETFKLHLLFHNPAIVLKKELLDIPFWGWYLNRADMIPIDRAAGGKVFPAMMTAARKAVERGRKIVIFPQGTRVAPGAEKPYKNGVANLYQELNLPVVPMALNSGVFWPKDSFIKKPGKITVSFLPPIEPGLSRDELMQKLKTDLEAEANRLIAEAKA